MVLVLVAHQLLVAGLVERQEGRLVSRPLYLHADEPQSGKILIHLRIMRTCVSGIFRAAQLILHDSQDILPYA